MTQAVTARPAAPAQRIRWREIGALVASLLGFKLLVQLAVAGRYGWFIDEFYYLACARHLAWGYVDHPPLSIALLRLWTALFGDGLVAVRVLPALWGAAALLLTVSLAREFGATRRGVLLAAFAFLANPVFWSLDHFYSMNALETLLWTATIFVFARLLAPDRDPRRESRGRWLLRGALLGLALLNKLGTLWLGAGLAVGLGVTPERRRLRSPWPWAAAGMAGLLFLPHVLWQVQHGWPTVEFIRCATQGKYGGITRAGFALSVLLEYNPLTFPVWLAGIVLLLRSRPGGAAPFRAIGLAWLVVFLTLVANGHSRSHYLSGAMPALYAAGGAALESLFRRARWRWGLPPVLVLLAGSGLAALPAVLPVLPPAGSIEYTRALGISPRSAESASLEGLPQHLADQLGWEELVGAVEAACHRLGPDERARACVFAPFYGAAGAIERLGRGRGLPPVISPHNAYWHWGPGSCDGSVLIVLDGSREELEALFASVEPAGSVPPTFGAPERNGMPVWIARQAQVELPAAWSRLRRFD